MAETPTGGHSAPLTVVHHRLGEVEYTAKLPADGFSAIEVNDVALLFGGQYLRQDSDLVISGDGRSILIENYFGSEYPALLVAPNGARIDGATVNALAGPMAPGQYAQAGASPNLVEIGKVVTLEGTASSLHTDGVKDELAIGSVVYQGDVVETGADTKLGISFIDKTLFSLSANARMVLDELIFNPGEPANNSMVMNLVQGAFVFVTGEIAPTGSMQVQTPIATMGIRGTTPMVLVDADMGVTEFTILPDPDTGNIGSYVLVNRATGEIMGRVDSVADKWVVSSLSGDAVKIGKTGNDLIEDEAALDEIREVFSRAFGDRTDIDAARPPAQIALASEAGNQQEGGGDENGGETGGTDGTPPSGTPDDPPIAGDDAFNIVENGYLAAPGGTPVSQLENIIYIGGNSVSVAGPSVTDGSIGGKDIDPDGFSFAVTQVNGTTLPYINGEARVLLPSGAFLEVQPNGQIDYFDNLVYEYLAKDEIAVETFTYTITDLYGKTDTATVTVTITGTNDTPDITPVVVTGDIIDVEEDVEENPPESADTLQTSGSITYLDLDLTDQVIATESVASVTYLAQDGQTVLTLTAAEYQAIVDAFSIDPTTVQDNEGTVSWDYQIEEGELDFLGAGEVVTAIFTITLTDDSGQIVAAGPNEVDNASQDVTITIRGATVDEPVVSIESGDTSTGGRTETNAALTVSGTLTVRDVDTTDVVDMTVETVSVGGTGAASVPDSLTNETIKGFLTVTETGSPDGDDLPAEIGDTNNITWTFNSGTEAFDFLAKGETLVLTYTVEATDDEGGDDTQTVTVTITGTNDTPEIAAVDVTGAVTEDAATLADNPNTGATETGAFLTDTGSITFTDLDVTDKSDSTVALKSSGGIVYSAGVTPDAALNAALASAMKLTGDIANDNEGTVNWTFALDSGLTQFLAAGETVTVTYVISVKDASGQTTASGANEVDTATQEVTVTITGTNDTPEIVAVNVIGAVTEDLATVIDNPNTGATETGAFLTDSGSITFSDLDVTDTSDSTVSLKSSGGIVYSAGVTPDAALDAALATALQLTGDIEYDNEGTVNWTFALDGGLTQFLAAGETVTVTYVISVKDDSGQTTASGANEVDTATQEVTVTITGTNDTPVITAGDVSQTQAEAETAINASGSFDVLDVDVTDIVTISATIVTTGGNDGGAPSQAALLAMFTASPASVIDGTQTTGTVNWSFDSGADQFDYLAVGEQLDLTYRVTVTDDHGATDYQDIILTITGTNDVPVVAAADVIGGVTEPVTPSGNLTDTGAISFTDVDLSDTHSISTTIVASGGALGALTASVTTDTDGAGLGGVIAWEYTVAASAVEYLADTQTKEETFTITLDDGNGGTVERTITVTITGTNDAPTVTATAAAGYTEGLDASGQDLTGNGTINFNDVDASDVVDISAELSGDVEWSAGTIDPGLATTLENGFTASATDEAAPGTTPWSYLVSDIDLDFLGEGETLDFSFEVTATDSHAATATDTVDFTVTGTNDTPVVNSIVADNVQAGAGERSIEGTLVFADHDVNDLHTVILGDPEITYVGSGTAPTEDPGELSFGTINPGTKEVGWSYTLADGSVPVLAQGETLTIASTISIMDDSLAANAQSTGVPVTITFVGTDGEPLIALDLDGYQYLVGTPGADRFVLAPGENIDEILDFNTGADELDLSGLLAPGYDPNDISITENGSGGATVNVAGTDIATLDSIFAGDSIKVIYNNVDADIQVNVAGAGV